MARAFLLSGLLYGFLIGTRQDVLEKRVEVAWAEAQQILTALENHVNEADLLGFLEEFMDV